MRKKLNSEWRVRTESMGRCCYLALGSEMYRRDEAKEALLRVNDLFVCPECKTVMICDPGTGGRLRWRVKPA